MKNNLYRQEFALKNPYYDPYQFNPGVKQIVEIGKLKISSVICVDAFLTVPLWHTSASLLSKTMQPKQLIGGTVTVKDFEVVVSHLRQLLENIGVGETFTINKPTMVFHLYKALSPAELERITKRPKVGH